MDDRCVPLVAVLLLLSAIIGRDFKHQTLQDDTRLNFTLVLVVDISQSVFGASWSEKLDHIQEMNVYV